MADNIGIKLEASPVLADKLEGLILSILNTSAGDVVKVKALEILEEAFPGIRNTSISNIHIQMPQPERDEYAYKEPEDTNQGNLDEEEDC